MANNHELRNTIVKVSGELFMKQSYAATSIKQIAKAAGCTTAALYYYFEDGKEGILHEVLDDAMPDLLEFLEPLEGAASLHELSLGLGRIMLEEGREMLRSTRWLMVEFPNMGTKERAKLHHRLMAFHRALADLIEPFVAVRHAAEMLAWVQYCALLGYGQLFVTLDLLSHIEPPGENYIEALAHLIEQAEGITS